jgi:hypothetical protein
VEHSPSKIAPLLEAESEIKSAHQSCGLMGFQKNVVHRVYLHMRQVVTAEVLLAKGMLNCGPWGNSLSPMNVSCQREHFLMDER